MGKNWGHIQRSKGHRSGLEDKVSDELKSRGIDAVSYTHLTLPTKA